jgi:hypothetical protein
MILPFTATWKKAAGLQNGRQKFHYIFEKDVEKEWAKHSYDGLNEGRKMAVRFYWLKAELNNGGLDQYFWNSSGGFAADTILDLRRIGQSQAADILSKASQKLFGEAESPADTSVRRQSIESHYGTHPFNDDDDQERLAVLTGKENLDTETRELAGLMKQVTEALVQWMFANKGQFTRLKESS